VAYLHVLFTFVSPNSLRFHCDVLLPLIGEAIDKAPRRPYGTHWGDIPFPAV
jgi:hypothetical protein